MAISFVAAAADVKSSTNSTSAVVNCPAGVADGDVVIIAATTVTNTGSSSTFTAPSGFTVKRTTQTSNSFELAQCIMIKIASSEPSSYTVSWSQQSNMHFLSAVAYRGASGTILAENSATEATTASPLATPTVNNTDANSWRITVGSITDGAGDTPTSPTTNEVSRRAGGTTFSVDGTSYWYNQQFWDSNGAVATGNHSRTLSATSAPFWTAIAWIGLLEAGSATPASGTISSTLGALTASSAGEVHDDATMACTLGAVTFDGAGYGTPPAVTGTLAGTLGNIDASVSGATVPAGTLDCTVLPAISFQGETRVFGNRVITVEFDDSRIITVQSRGVDD